MELKDLKTREKVKEIYLSEVGNQGAEDYIKANPGKSGNLIFKIMSCEIEAVKEYSNQFIEFINSGEGYRTPAEFVYVLCGLRLALRSLLSMPFDKEIKQKIKELNEMVKKCVGSVCGYVEKPTEKDDA